MTKNIGDVGYKFRKRFDCGWFVGEVVKIRPGAANGRDRRVIYEDGDLEDLSVAELKALARLDPRNKPRSRSTSPKPPASTKPVSTSGDSDSLNHSLVANNNAGESSNEQDTTEDTSPLRRSNRELTANVKLACYQLEEPKTKDANNPDSNEYHPTRKSSRDRRPTRMYEEISMYEAQQKQLKRSSSSTSSRPLPAAKIQKLLSSLDDDAVPIDKAAENTFTHDEPDEDINDGMESDNEQHEWLEKVASQLGARPMSRSSDGEEKPAALPGGRSVSEYQSEKREVTSICSSENNDVPASVLVPGSIPQTLLTIEKGSRHEYLVYNKDSPERIAGQVIVEGSCGWVEVCFGGAELVKCRSSHLVVLPRGKFGVGDVVPEDFVGGDVVVADATKEHAARRQLKTPEDVKAANEKKLPDKKANNRKQQTTIDLNNLFYWVCHCSPNAFNGAFDQSCNSCHTSRAPHSKTSKLLEIAQDVVNNDYVTSLDEALVQIPEPDRQSIPQIILTKLLEAKFAGMSTTPLPSNTHLKIESFFYWSCGSCTMTNTYKKGSCHACREAKGYFARSSPLLLQAEKIAVESKNSRDAYATWPAYKTRQIPESVMDALITCIHIIRKKGTERRCRNRKLDGLDYCGDHCDPALLSASHVNVMEEEDVQVDVKSLQQRKSLMGIEGMKQNLHNFFTRIDTVRNAMGWAVNSIEDSLICTSDSKPFPLGLKVRTYFIGHGFHDGRIIKVRRQFLDDGSQDRPVLMYRIVYNDGDQQDWLHHNIASLRQVFDVNNVNAESGIEVQIPIGSRFELRTGCVVKVTGHGRLAQDEHSVSFVVEDGEMNAQAEDAVELSILKFQVAVKVKISSSNSSRVNASIGGSVLEWPPAQDRIEPNPTGMQYKVCNGLHLLNKSHIVEYAAHPIQKLLNVDDPCDVRPGVKMNRWDPANVYNHIHWDPSQCLVCELCGIDKDDNQVVICEECHLGFHSYCLRPVMVNIPTSNWVCRECSGRSNSISFVDYSKSISGQQQSVLEFLNLPYTTYADFVKENSDAVSFSRSPSPYNPNQHTAVDRNLFSVGSILFVRSPDKHDFRLPSLALTEEEYACIIESSVAAMKYCGMSMYSQTNLYPQSGNTTEEMNNFTLEREHIAPLSKRNLSIFRAFKENLKRGVFPPIKVMYDEKYGFYVEALKPILKHTLITEYIGEVITLEQSSESDSLMILLDSGDPKTSLIIDPTNAGNVARFLSGVNNKSLVSKRKANVRTRRFCLDGKIHVALFTSRRIEPGERLNYDYNLGRQGQSSEEWLKGGFYDTSNFF